MSAGKPVLTAMDPIWREPVGILLAEAFHAKLGRMAGLDAARLARAFALVGEGSGETRILALMDGQLAGTLLLRRCPAYGSRVPIAGGGMVGMRLVRSIGLRPTLSITLALSMLGHRPTAGEWYIGDVAVGAAYRGQGIGALLIGEARRRAAAGRARLTLHVAAGNPGARRLYERLGFRVVGSTVSRSSRWLFGEGRWLYMSCLADGGGEAEWLDTRGGSSGQEEWA